MSPTDDNSYLLTGRMPDHWVAAESTEQPRRTVRIVSLAVFAAVVMMAGLLLVTVVAGFSRQGSWLLDTNLAWPVSAVLAAALVFLVFPLWPGPLIGRSHPVEEFWRWLGWTVAELALVLLVTTPFIVAGATFSGVPLTRLGELYLALGGLAAAGLALRYVHQSCSTRLRSLALLKAVMLTFGPLVAGYLVMEFTAREMTLGGFDVSWIWLLSPLALLREVALEGLHVGRLAFVLAVIAYPVLAALAIVLTRPLARRHYEEQLRLSAK